MRPTLVHTTQTRSVRSAAALLAAVLLVAGFGPAPAAADLSPAAAAALDALRLATGGNLVSHTSDASGNLSFVRATGGALLSADSATADPAARALTFLDANAGLFGITATGVPPLGGLVTSHPELAVVGVEDDALGQTHVRLAQTHAGVPVFGGQLVVHMNDLGIVAVNGTFVPGVATGASPLVTAAQAGILALDAARAANRAAVASSELVVYPAGLFEGRLSTSRLAWSVRIAGPELEERIFVDARNGETLARYSERHEALFRVVYSPEYDPSDPSANVQRSEGDPPSPLVPVNNLYDFAGQVYELFDNGFDRDSYDGAGAVMRSVYLVNDICPNAYWNSQSTNYCPGFDTDDIVAHEWGHAYTEHTHGLIYFYQSGALNESYSDIFGEIVDLNNGVDSPVGGSNNAEPFPAGQRWIIGEDLVGPAQNSLLTRDMWDPERLGSPAKVSSASYVCGTGDNGGVHTNSGVPNHAFAMLVDGQTYNGQTVGGIGFNRAAHIYYRAMSVYQVPSTNFAGHADALQASCADLRDSAVELDDLFSGGPSGEIVTDYDCEQLAAALVAVEMRTPPTQCNYQPLLDPRTPPLCDGASTIFQEDFESGLGGWSTTSNGVNPEWPGYEWEVVGSLPEARTGSAAFAIDSRAGTCAPGGDFSGTYSIDGPTIAIPAGATSSQVRFDHYVETELTWDGGNLMVSVNGGPYTLVPESAHLFNPPNGELETSGGGNTNPKAGQLAWHGADGGETTGSWGTSIVNLSGLAGAGDTVSLRFDFGIDGCNGVTGWYVDNVHAYTCNGDGLFDPPAAPVQQPIEDDASPDQVDGIDRDGAYRISWTYPELPAEPACGFRVEEATIFTTVLDDDAEELLVAGSNSTWTGDPEWHSELHPDTATLGYTPLYHDLSTAQLTLTSPVTIPAGHVATLSFDSFEDIEEGFDQGVVLVSPDGGAFQLAATYTGAFSGRRTVDLSGFSGHSVQVAFVLQSDFIFSFPQFQGWFVDNILLETVDFTPVGTVDGDTFHLDLTGRADGTYWYRVVGLFRGCDDPLEGPYSNLESIEVQNDVVTAAPTASFTATPNPAETGETVTFDGSASADNDAEGPAPEIVSYFWSFGDGATEITTGPTASHAYAAEGTYRVSLRVTDNDGETDFAELLVQVDDGGSTGGDDDKVTGGGHIQVDGGQANFGFNAKRKNGALSGSLTFQDHPNGVKVKADAITELTISGTEASFSGPCTINKVPGFTFTVTVEDAGEPGSSDVFRIELSDGYEAAGTLSGGNIQVH